MLTRSNSDSNFFRDKAFIDNINNKISEIDNLAERNVRKKFVRTRSRKDTEQTTVQKDFLKQKSLEETNKNRKFLSINLEKSPEKENSDKLEKKSLKIFLKKFWRIQMKADFEFRTDTLPSLKIKVNEI